MQYPRPLSSALLALLLIALGVPAKAADLNVAVSSKPIHSLVAGVMGNFGRLSLIVEGASSPHTFTLRPSGARALFNADIVFRVSESLEPFTRKISRSLPPSVTLVSLAEAPGVSHLPLRAGGAFDRHGHDAHAAAGHGDHEEPAGEGAPVTDPHVWLDPSNAKAMTAEIARVLGRADPENAAAYLKNASETAAKIDDLDSELRAKLEPVAKRPFVVFHDATQYFERHFGMAAAGSITVSPDVQPSALRLTEVRRRIKALGAVCVFAEPHFQPKLIAAVTEGTEARAATLDAEGLTFTAGPELYFELMRAVASQLVACLSGS